MADIFRTANLSDAVVLIHENGDREHIAWCSMTIGKSVPRIHVTRMPMTAKESRWLAEVLPTRLALGGSIRLVGDSRHG